MGNIHFQIMQSQEVRFRSGGLCGAMQTGSGELKGANFTVKSWFRGILVVSALYISKLGPILWLWFLFGREWFPCADWISRIALKSIYLLLIVGNPHRGIMLQPIIWIGITRRETGEICAPTITASSGALVAVGQWEQEEEGDKYQQLIAASISLLRKFVS